MVSGVEEARGGSGAFSGAAQATRSAAAPSASNERIAVPLIAK